MKLKYAFLFLTPLLLASCGNSFGITSPKNGLSFSVTSDTLNEFLDQDYDTTLMDSYWDKGFDAYYPSELLVTSSASATGAELSTDADFTDSLKAAVYVGECTYTNLLAGQDYYLRVTNDEKTSRTVSFSTKPGIRTLNVQYVKNIRDCGNWASYDNDGNRIGTLRQGLLYRSGHLDNAEKKGQATLKDELGIQTEIDLRKESEVAMSFVPFLPNYLHLDCPQYAASGTGIFDEDAMTEIRAIFSELARKDNYPVIYHCALGRDRTGTLAFLLGCLLGMSEDDLCRDYDLSMFFNDGDALNPSDFHRNAFNALIRGIQNYGSVTGTLYENVRVYLKDAGLTDDEMDAIRDILIERE